MKCETRPIRRASEGQLCKTKPNFEQPDRGPEGKMCKTNPNLGRMGHLEGGASASPIVQNEPNFVRLGTCGSGSIGGSRARTPNLRRAGLCKTKPIGGGVSSLKCQVSSQRKRVPLPPSLPTSNFTPKTAAEPLSCETKPIPVRAGPTMANELAFGAENADNMWVISACKTTIRFRGGKS